MKLNFLIFFIYFSKGLSYLDISSFNRNFKESAPFQNWLHDQGYSSECINNSLGANVSYSLCNEIVTIFGVGPTYNFSKNTSPLGFINARIVTIKSNVTSIGDYLFQNTHIGQLNISTSVKYISPTAFQNCDVENIYTPGTNENFHIENGGLISLGTRRKFIKYSNGQLNSSYEIPQDVEEIYDYAFENCQNLINITIGANVKSLSGISFVNCNNLENFVVNKKRKVNYYVEDGALISKSNQMIIKFPANNANQQYKIPESITGIAEYAFENCRKLQAVVITKGIKQINPNSFVNCTNLANFTSKNDQYKSTGGVLFLKNMTQLIKYPSGLSNVSYKIPSTVNSIADYAFDHCHYLQTIQISRNLTGIGNYAFSNCRNLTNITEYSPKDMKLGRNSYSIQAETDGSIGMFAFSNCNQLNKVTIPPGITKIRSYGFFNCHQLSEVVIQQLEVIETHGFYDCSAFTLTYLGKNSPNCTKDAFSLCPNIQINVTLDYYGSDFCEITSIPPPTETPTTTISETPTPTISETPTPTISEPPTPTISETPTPTISETPTTTISEPPTTIPTETSITSPTQKPTTDPTEIITTQPITISQTNTETYEPTSSSDSSSGKKTGIIVGVSVGVVACILIAIVVVIILYRKRKNDAIREKLLSQSLSIYEELNS